MCLKYESTGNYVNITLYIYSICILNIYVPTGCVFLCFHIKEVRLVVPSSVYRICSVAVDSLKHTHIEKKKESVFTPGMITDSNEWSFL